MTLREMFIFHTHPLYGKGALASRWKGQDESCLIIRKYQIHVFTTSLYLDLNLNELSWKLETVWNQMKHKHRNTLFVHRAVSIQTTNTNLIKLGIAPFVTGSEQAKRTWRQYKVCISSKQAVFKWFKVWQSFVCWWSFCYQNEYRHV